jgi:hypothetical protein
MEAGPTDTGPGAAETVVHDHGAGTREGAGRFRFLRLTRAGIQARLFGVGGLIHAAVGSAERWRLHEGRFEPGVNSCGSLPFFFISRTDLEVR